jgi:hypothetical protein
VPGFESRVTNVKFLESKLAKVFNKLDFHSIEISNQDDLYKIQERYPKVTILPKTDLNQDNSTGWIPGELGYWFSNYGAARAFEKSSANLGDICLVFDDDVWLNVDAGGVLELIPHWIAQLPADWDYLNLYVDELQRAQYDSDIHGSIENVLCKNYGKSCSVAMAWSTQGFKKLMNVMHAGINNPFDIQLYSTPELNGYTLLPEKHEGVSYYSELQYYDHSTIRSNSLRFNL